MQDIGRTQLEWEQAGQGVALGGEHEDTGFPGTDILERTHRLFGSVRGAREAAVALARGERDENRLTDVIFYARHPEYQGRRIQRSEQQMAREWMAIRDSIVRPVLPMMFE